MKIRGFRIEPGEIETPPRASTRRSRAAAVVGAGGRAGRAPAAAYVVEDRARRRPEEALESVEQVAEWRG